jgi:hypothetical protein
MLEVAGNGGDPSEWRLWWHSHVNFQAFWSGTDTDTIDDFDTEEDKGNWFLSIVGNKKGEYKTRLDVFKPFRYTFEELPVELEIDEELDKEIDEEMRAKIKEPPKPPALPGGRKNKKHGKGLVFKKGGLTDEDLDTVDLLRMEFYDRHAENGFMGFTDATYDSVRQKYGNQIVTRVFYKVADKWYPIKPDWYEDRGRYNA